MSEMSQFSAREESIRTLLTGVNNVYKISRFQRPYAWGKKQQEDLILDIINALSKNSSDEYEECFYFLGTVILHGQKDGSAETSIVDGQQRIITIIMIFVIIRDMLKEISQKKNIDEEDQKISSSLSEEIAKYIYIKEDGKESPIIWPLQEEERKFFFENILQYNSASKKKKTMNDNKDKLCIRYSEGYLIMKSIIEKKCKGINLHKKIYLLRAIYRQAREAKIVAIYLSNENESYSIYSDINSKGLSLTQQDLIKNDIFYKTNNVNCIPGLDKISDKWNSIYNSIIYKTAIPFDTFYKYCWYIIHPEDLELNLNNSVNMFELFQKKYPSVKQGEEIKDFLDQLEEFSLLLFHFIEPNSVKQWKKDDWPIVVKKIDFANATAKNSIVSKYVLWLLPLYYNWIKEKESTIKRKYESLLKKMITFVADTIFIYQIIGMYDISDITLGKFDHYFEFLFNKLVNFKIVKGENNSGSLIEELKVERFLIIDNITIIEKQISMLRYSKYNGLDSQIEYVKYILRRLNEDESSYQIDNTKGSIEHILEDEVRTEISSNLGNLVYLEEILNKECSELKVAKSIKNGQLLNEKIKIYTKSSVPEVIELISELNPYDFSKSEVKERAEMMATKFIKKFIQGEAEI